MNHANKGRRPPGQGARAVLTGLWMAATVSAASAEGQAVLVDIRHIDVAGNSLLSADQVQRALPRLPARMGFADIERELEQLGAALDQRGLDDLRQAQVDLGEVVDSDRRREVFAAGRAPR